MSNKNLRSYCEHIRCLKCDHLVMLLTGHKWADSADYLFFRLNFPNRQKLNSRLLKDAQFSCYACQCQHININISKPSETARIDEISKEWQCCGH